MLINFNGVMSKPTVTALKTLREDHLSLKETNYSDGGHYDFYLFLWGGFDGPIRGTLITIT